MGTTYYVSAATGNNNNPGNQPDKPLRTIQAAINKTQAGDRVTVGGGTYAERLHIQKPGTVDAPIVIAANEGESPVIDGANLIIPRDTALLTVEQSQAITISGLTIRNAGGIGLIVSKSSQVTVRETTIDSSYAGGLHMTQSDNVLVERCRIFNCGRRFLAHGPERDNVALLTRHSSDLILRDNQVYENSDEGIAVSVGSRKVIVSKNVCYDNRNGQIGITSAVDVVVDGNLCYHTGRPQFLTLNQQRGPGITKHDLWQYETRGLWHTRNVRIMNNIVIGCGVGLRAGRRKGRFSSVQISHNTILNSTRQAIDLGLRTTSTKSYIENNLIATANGAELAHTLGGEGIVWRHNLWSAFPGEKVYNPSSDVISPDIGLVNANAAISAGQVSVDAYKLVDSSPAIDHGIRRNGDVLLDYWGIARDSQPDIGAYEFPNGSGDEPGGDTDLPPDGTRVTKGLVALYDFKEGQGRQVRDVSGVGDPLHLRIMNEGGVTWSAQGLKLDEPALITSERPATKIVNACRSTQEITLEAWIQPSNVTQDGPARIISISKSKTERNVTLGQGLHGNQPADLYMVRLRTSQTSINGLPAVVSPAGSAAADMTHVVYTRHNNKRATLYINGQDRGLLDIDGNFNSWDDKMPLLLGNELSEDRPWLGLLKLCAVYSRALTPAEVLHNYEADIQSEVSILAEFTISAGDELGIAPHVVEFDSSESFAAATITTYFWEFGDGQTANRANPAYTYTTPGIYTVSLTITDANGLTDKVSKERLIAVVETPVTPLPADYARFILVNIENSNVLAFGVQYPDLRCTLMWNDVPYHMSVYSDVDDVMRNHTGANTVELIWVDVLEEE
ncbi:MAG: right-handed parallel beta-helix repeat-containing protein [Candidatus Promineofilum sp.]|nr:right-handed parallel beta-helix repeat-containing protein [Promineifilum sp.]